MIGIGHKSKRVLSKSAYKNGRIFSSKQDGNREFITLLASIYATGSHMPPALFY